MFTKVNFLVRVINKANSVVPKVTDTQIKFTASN